MLKDVLRFIAYASLFLVPFVPILISESMFFPYITGKNFTFRILIEIGLFAWILLAILDREYRPKFSWLAVFGLVTLVVMFFANLLGEYAPQSFWSNFERMEGYVTLVHFFIYFLLLGTLLRTPKLWNYFLHTSLAVATYVALFGLGQSTGFIEGATDRVDSTLGNAAYMAVYMLFHIFIAFFLFIKNQHWLLRTAYSLLGLLFIYILLETGTRGTFIGLVVGAGVTVVYLALFGRNYPEVRKVAIVSIVLLVLCGGLFFTFKDSQFVQQSGALHRIATISLEKDLVVRTTIWGMALEGVKEHPILGWGQGNFNYVFNKYYEPSLYGQEQWFDRVHNIFFDWLIAGGVLGFLAYFGILFSALYYLFWRPLFIGDESFTVLERAALLGILAGYFTHNLVVFDNIVSYMFYAIVLAIIHSRVATTMPKVESYSMDEQVVNLVAAPLVVVMAAATIYFVNVPGILAAQDIIDAFRGKDVDEKMAEFQSALNRGSFANQEINEQMASLALPIAQSSSVDQVDKVRHFGTIESEFRELVTQKPNDARLHFIFAGFYRYISKPDKALEQLSIAEQLSPRKPQLFIEKAFASIQAGRMEQALGYLKTAHELAPDFKEARVYYAVGALLAGRDDLFLELASIEDLEQDEALLQAFAQEDMVVTAAHEMNQYDFLKYILEERIKLNPTDAQARTNLAIAYYETGDTKRAIEILKQAVADIPSFKEQGEEFIADFLSGKAVTR